MRFWCIHQFIVSHWPERLIQNFMEKMVWKDSLVPIEWQRERERTYTVNPIEFSFSFSWCLFVFGVWGWLCFELTTLWSILMESNWFETWSIIGFWISGRWERLSLFSSTETLPIFIDFSILIVSVVDTVAILFGDFNALICKLNFDSLWLLPRFNHLAVCEMDIDIENG